MLSHVAEEHDGAVLAGPERVGSQGIEDASGRIRVGGVAEEEDLVGEVGRR